MQVAARSCEHAHCPRQVHGGGGRKACDFGREPSKALQVCLAKVLGQLRKASVEVPQLEGASGWRLFQQSERSPPPSSEQRVFPPRLSDVWPQFSRCS